MKRASGGETIVITAAEVAEVTNVYADRVHDDVRRNGCSPEQAGTVVTSSALDLVDAAARDPDRLGDLAGWWFARAQELADVASSGADAGLAAAGTAPHHDGDPAATAAFAVNNESAQRDDSLAADGADDDAADRTDGYVGERARVQRRLSAALARMPQQERSAVLLRDGYDLAPATVATALRCDAERVREVVAQGRLVLLTCYQDEPVKPPDGHITDVGTLGLLAEDSREGARELGVRTASARRHAQTCPGCRDVLDAQARARALLHGLSVHELPDDERERLLTQVRERAAQTLPAAGSATPIPAPMTEPPTMRTAPAEPRHGPLIPVWVVTLSLVLAAALGIAVGFALPGASTS